MVDVVPVLEARLRLRHAGCITERLPAGAQVTHVSGDRDGDVLAIHALTEAHVEQIMRELGALQPRAPEVLSRTALGVVARCRAGLHAVPSLVQASGCSLVWPVVYANGDEVYTVLAPGRDRLDGLVAQLQRMGRVHVESVTEVRPGAAIVNVPLSDITSALTERQLFVLQKAITEGYYDSPRRTSTEALAASFGVTRSTLEEHLRKAERRVLEGFASVITAQPVLARAAARRPGRPALRAAR